MLCLEGQAAGVPWRKVWQGQVLSCPETVVGAGFPQPLRQGHWVQMPALSFVTLVVLRKGVEPCLQMSPAAGRQPPRNWGVGYWYAETFIPAVSGWRRCSLSQTDLRTDELGLLAP